MSEVVIKWRCYKGEMDMSEMSALKIHKVMGTSHIELSEILYEDLGQPKAVYIFYDSDYDVVGMVNVPLEKGQKVETIGNTKLVLFSDLYFDLYLDSVIFEEEDVVLLPCIRVEYCDDGEITAVFDTRFKVV